MFMQKLALVLFLLPAASQAQVMIQPQAGALLPGRTCAFRVSLEGHRAVDPAEWTWTRSPALGSLDEATGRYTAPDVAEPTLVAIQVQRRSAPRTKGHALLLLLPWLPFDIVGKVDPGWLSPYSEELPFLGPFQEPEAGRAVDTPGSPRDPDPFVGYGLPFTLSWTPQPRAESQRLTLVQGNEATCLDVTGQDRQEFTLTGRVRRCRVEGFAPCRWRAADFVCLIQEFRICLRGLVPMAGNPLAEPGHVDAAGLSARFREPFGLAQVFEGDALSRRPFYLVTDPGSQVIRKVSGDGTVKTPWGLPDQPGHLDAAPPSMLRSLASALFRRGSAPASPSQFNHPTFLLASYRLEGRPGESRYRWRAWVADTGNHVIRMLRPDGTTATLAGTPGLPGYQDSEPNKTPRFHTPQGLALDRHGYLYVADQGNQVIRRITAAGKVETVAGSPGKAGSQDGLGPAARFTHLQGLVFDDETQSLLAVDGHAIRRVQLPGGEVTTLLGVVAIPGCGDVQEGNQEEREWALGDPRLNEPCGITAIGSGIFVITDTGNHSVRFWSPGAALLLTQVGDPDQGLVRWGLLADHMGVPGDEDYAALASPRTVAATQESPRTLLVTTGPCVAEFPRAVPAWEELPRVVLDCPSGSCHEPCTARFTLWAGNGAEGTELRYSVDFIEGGKLAERLRGTARPGIPVAVEGTFTRPGKHKVVVRCVNSRGLSAGAQQEVRVH
jgi:hypothetical protein